MFQFVKLGRGRGYTSIKGAICYTKTYNSMARFSDFFSRVASISDLCVCVNSEMFNKKCEYLLVMDDMFISPMRRGVAIFPPWLLMNTLGSYFLDDKTEAYS